MDEYARWLASLLNQSVNPFSRDERGRPWTQRGVPGFLRGLVENVQRHPIMAGIDATPIVGDVKALGYDLPMALREGQPGLAALAAVSALPMVPGLVKSLPMDEASRMARAREMGFDVDRTWYHGTTHEFDRFGGEYHNPEGHYGAGHYFTSSTEDASRNYAGMGPDLTSRIEQRAEQLASEADLPYDDPGVRARAIAELKGTNEGNIIPAHVRGNVVSTVPGQSTFLDYDYTDDPANWLDDAKREVDRRDFTYEGEFDEDAWKEAVDERALEMAQDNLVEPRGKLADVLDGLRTAMNDAYDADFSRVMDDLEGHLYDGGLRADELEKILRGSEGLMYATDDSGRLVAHDLIRQAYERAGFDAIEMDATAQGWNMDIPAGTRHLIVNDPATIRSKWAAFDPARINDPDLLASLVPILGFGVLARQQQQRQQPRPPLMGVSQGVF